MKKKTHRLASLVLALLLVFNMLATSASSANYTSDYTRYSTPSSTSDYAYWNGWRVVRASGTTTSEVKWMQAALNYCIMYKGLNATKLDVDGSFGPASRAAVLAFQKAYGLERDGSFGPSTIQKMKAVLSDGKATSSGTISTQQIQSILNRYGYVDGKFWTYPSGGSSKSGYFASTRYGRNYSYNYYGSTECAGFAGFVMGEVTGKSDIMSGNAKGWTKITGKNNVSSLKVGDIVRAGGHSAIVLTVDSNGKCTFAECWGSYGCEINIGKFNNSYSTLNEIKNAYPNSFSHIWRYTG